MQITVVGQGYVGLPLAIEAAKSGYKVYGLDNNLERINLLANGKSVIEDISDKVIKETDYNVAFTNKTSKFTGASDLLLNADLSFLNEWNDKKNNITTTIAYSHFSDRIYAIGTNDRGNLIDKGFGSLDFIAKSKLNNKWNLGIVFKNILDPSIERVQENTNETINVLSYKKGINFSLNVSYQF